LLKLFSENYWLLFSGHGVFSLLIYFEHIISTGHVQF